MVRQFLPILLLLGFVILNAVIIIGIANLISVRAQPTAIKKQPYESGIAPLGDARERFSVKFYLVAMLFIVFDIETVFLIPWAVAMRPLGWSAFIAALIFIVVLTVGMIYEWKKGALEWE